METSMLIAKIIGIIYLSFGLGLLINTKVYQKILNQLLTDPSIRIIGGFMAVIIGVLILEYHNVWEADWTLVISIIGWAALLKGILLLAFPSFINVAKPLFANIKSLRVLGVFVLIFGIVFTYLGFCPC
jgi:uncharacterized protein YjeT (DUF2065 family)